jgi:hypothetical protein
MTTKVVSIVDNGSLIILTAQSGDMVGLQKLDAKLKYTPDAVFIYDTKVSGNAPLQVEDDCYVLHYESVTTPVTTDNEDLADTIDGYLNS